MTQCKAAINIKGEHFWCDWPSDEDGRHDGWAHSNTAAEAIWSSPIPTVLPCGHRSPFDDLCAEPDGHSGDHRTANRLGGWANQ